MTLKKTEHGIDEDIADAIEGHRRFKQQYARDREFYQSLAVRQQRPRLLWIGCCDSRVVPAQITSADPGELFEMRNIANVVPPVGADDDSVGAAIEYAVNHLGIDDIVVCGHTGCGGIKAVIDGMSFAGDPHLGRWVAFARPAARLVEVARVPEAQRLDAAVRANVQFQLDNLLTYPCVAERLAAGRLHVHGWLYAMETADLLAYDRDNGDWRPLMEHVMRAAERPG